MTADGSCFLSGFNPGRKAKDEKFSESAVSLRLRLLTHDAFQFSFCLIVSSLEWIMETLYTIESLFQALTGNNTEPSLSMPCV